MNYVDEIILIGSALLSVIVILYLFSIVTRPVSHNWRKIFNTIKIPFIMLLFVIVFSLGNVFLPEFYQPLVQKSAAIALVATITWMLLKLVNLVEENVEKQITKDQKETNNTQKVLTHLTIAKKIILLFIIVVSAIVILMMFENVRKIGATLIASAGVIAAIITFTAQKTLANIFYGLQISLSQPIRMHDVVLVENEFGTVEDINLSNVVIRLWDLRRLVVPISYFIDKPFQNWSRETDYLFGTVFLFVDYNTPIDKLRHKFESILDKSTNWDGKLQNVQVSEVYEHSIQVRFLASAENASKLWDLRCEVREKLVNYLQKYLPESLPKYHLTTVNGSAHPKQRTSNTHVQEMSN